MSALNAGAWPRLLLDWYHGNARDLPWRRKPTPYRVWVSEIMLQQTQVRTVIPFYRRFLRRFPSVKRLAAAPLEEVLKRWEGLGYYHRARNLHRAAVLSCAGSGGRFPRTAAAWRQLPGVGDYTAAAVASIAFGERVPVIDGNVIRVFARFLAERAPADTAGFRRRLHDYLATHMPPDAPGDFNQAMMELGALVCRPGLPDCAGCPLRRECLARKQGLAGSLPLMRRKSRPPHVEQVAVLFERRGRILFCRRPPDGLLGGLWDLPTTVLRDGESPDAAARRLAAGLGVTVRCARPCGSVRHAYSHFTTTIHGILITCEVPPACRTDRRFADAAQRARLPLPTATRRLLAQTPPAAG